MKFFTKSILILAGISLLLALLQINFLLQPGIGYGIREQKKYLAEQRYKMTDSLKLLKIIDVQCYSGETIGGFISKFFKPTDSAEMAVNVLASRPNDKIAVQGLTDLIIGTKTTLEGDKWYPIYYAGKYKNKALVPALCSALKKHSNSHTDWLIVKALNEIDDPAALGCLVQERGKLKLSYACEKADEAIQRWSTKGK